MTPVVGSGITPDQDGPPPVQRSTQEPENIAVDDDSNSIVADVSTYTASLISSIRNFPVEHGRRFHAFRDGAYVPER